MKKVIIGGKVITLLTQLEKAREQKVLTRAIRDRLVKGKIAENQIAHLPGSTKVWYLPEGETHEDE